MERKVTKLENSHVEVLVNVDEATWKAAQKKAFEKVAANITVDGFRKGKAPENLVKSKVDQVKVMDEAINSLLPEIYRDIVEVDGVKPFTQPKVDVTKLSDTELEVKFFIVTAPEVELGQYKGLEIGHSKVEVTEEEVNNALKAVQEQNATLAVKEGASELGDTVVIDFAGSVDGKPFDGGSATNYELELGSHSFIPGFEEQLVGHKAGEHVDVKVKFPENYVENLKGKEAVFACDIHEVKVKKLPELDEELIAELKIPNVKTVEELKAHKKNELLSSKEVNEKREYISKVVEAIAKASKIEIPQEIIDSQAAARKEDLVNRMKQSGLTLEQYLQLVGQKEEELMAKLKEESVKDVTNFMVLETIAEKEHLEVSDEDLDFEFAKMADQYSMKVEDVKKALQPQLEEFRNNLKMQKVEQLLAENNK